jgi:phosphotransacetylase
VTKQHRATVNEGIQANTVTGDVIAVGRGAQAHKTVLGEGDRRQLLEAIDQLHQELNKLNVGSVRRDELKQHASEIEQIVTAKQSNPKEVEGVLGRFVQKLKEVGVIVKDVAGLVAPLQTIAALFHVSLASLGLPT